MKNCCLLFHSNILCLSVKDGDSGNLRWGAEPCLFNLSVVFVNLVLSFKFHQNLTINDQVIEDFVKFKMAAAAILDVAQNPASTIFQ